MFPCLKMPWRRLGAFALLWGAFAAAQAQGWKPAGPVEIVAGSSAGGALDRTARQVQAVIESEKLVPSPLVVVNKPGAGSAIAWNYLNRHAGEGNYLSVAIPGLISNRIVGTSEVSFRDFTPLAILSSEYVVFAVPAASNIRSGADLLKVARENPGKLNIGVATALGGANHVAVCEAMRAAGVDIRKLTFVVYASSAEAVTAVLGNHIDLVAASPGNLMPALETGKVRPIATTAPGRMGGALKDIPTWKEQGVDIAFASWRGIIGPKGMTPEQIRFWDEVLGRMAASGAWKKSIAFNQEDDTYMDSAKSRRFLDEENRSISAILQQLGLAKKN